MSDAAPPLADGRYRLISILGVGGMAVVYRGYDARLQVQRAIKILSPELSKKRSLRSRFEGEASTMALLEHPNIVRVYDVGADHDRVYIVMELVDGGSLLDRVKQGGKLPSKLALQVTIDMLDALWVAHRRGVVHRDIKPHNILLSSDGKLRITDFGIARMRSDETDGMTKTGAVMGTWGFMAPEQRVDAKSVDVRADLYSVGATLYSILTGKTPVDLFVADMDKSILADLDGELREIIKKSTRYDREDRYGTAQEMAEACRAILDLMPEDPPDTPALITLSEIQIGPVAVGGGTGLLGAGSGAPPAPASSPRAAGPAGRLTMVPDVDEDVSPPPPPMQALAAKPTLEQADSGLTFVDQGQPEQPKKKKGLPWGKIVGAKLLLIAGVGIGYLFVRPTPPVPLDPSVKQPVELASDPVLVPEAVPEVLPEVEPVVPVEPVKPDPAIKPRDPVLRPQVTAPIKETPKDPPAVLTVPTDLSHSKPSSARIGKTLGLKVVAPGPSYTVTLYYRPSGTGASYSSRTMRGNGGSFSAQISVDESFSGGLEYYIQAKPSAGGPMLKRGSGFSPLKVSVR